jgi:hypothetical protein
MFKKSVSQEMIFLNNRNLMHRHLLLMNIVPEIISLSESRFSIKNGKIRASWLEKTTGHRVEYLSILKNPD